MNAPACNRCLETSAEDLHAFDIQVDMDYSHPGEAIMQTMSIIKVPINQAQVFICRACITEILEYFKQPEPETNA